MLRSVEEFDLVLVLLGHVEWLADERFATHEDRLENYEILTDMIRAAIVEKTSAEWMELFRDNGINIALVAEFPDLPNDPQVLANDMAPEAPADMEMTRVVRDPINVDGVARVGPRKAPAPGEHSEEILGEMGYSAEQIALLKADGIV
jgi:crotonobetainyl-CoA:carnitine CoA-transferase CaiB-like acyl-CoA transferase